MKDYTILPVQPFNCQLILAYLVTSLFLCVAVLASRTPFSSRVSLTSSTLVWQAEHSTRCRSTYV